MYVGKRFSYNEELMVQTYRMMEVSHNMLLQANGITKLYGVTPVLDGINLQVLERERIGLVGVNGAGKSTLLKILAGEMSYDGGQIFKAKETTVGYLAQNSGLQSDSSIWNEMLDVFAPFGDGARAASDGGTNCRPEVERGSEEISGASGSLCDPFGLVQGSGRL